ncbi:restriction endonuclease subunit S [Acinetobacter sp. CIP 102136]|uniref:restriction endonuclease subunit S n=1 Tax=Acinetobacter sp. CIP 102136 TaxID=1144665 RepID=UPI0002D05CA8|nr:restriction endonuclease subunit S [Acinetobacter sp. CIP 102136]ENX18721.1 hypothetical protein F893_03120 [Acinetobacter sp. CIP 102136]
MSFTSRIKIEDLINNGSILVHKDGNHGAKYPRTEEFGELGVPFLTAKLLDNSGNIDLLKAPRLAKEKAQKFTFGFVQSEDVLLSHNATVGRVAVMPQVDEPILIGTSLTHFRLDKSKILPTYLAAYFSGKDFQDQLAAVMSQTTRNQVPITSQRKLYIELPSIEIQAEIVKYIDSIDNKIRLNNKINQTLESIAQAIFKSWFIDFDPVRAKIAAKQEGKDAELAAMCVISGKSEEELKQMAEDDFAELQATAALFPDELVESELGEVPKGWDAIALGNFLEIKRGGSPRPIQNFMAPTGYPWVKIADATADPSPFLFKTKEFIIKEGLRKTVYLKKGSLILTNSATPGLPKFLELDACIHDGWLYFPQKKHFSDNYLYFLFLKLRTQLVAQGNGSVFTNLKTDILRNQVVLVPTKEVIEKFDLQVGKILEMMKTQCIQSSNLSDLRDTLLPKLLSDKVSVLGFQGEVA